jgi:hypothetical protein
MIAEYYNDTLCIEAGWLTGQKILSEFNYKVLTQRGQLRIVRRGCLNTPALVDYSSIPDRFRKLIEEKCGGDPRKQARVNMLETKIEADSKAREFFSEYKLPGNIHLKPTVQTEYYNNAILLNAINRYMRRAPAHH